MESLFFLKISFIIGYGLLFGHPCNRSLILGDMTTWNIQPMGDIFLYNGFHGTKQYFDYNKSCFKFKKEGLEPSLCKPPEHTWYHVAVPFKSKLLGTLGFISSFFLMVTLLVYAISPSLRNLPGKALMCHVFSLAMAFFTQGNINLNPLAKTYGMDYFSYYLRKILGIK